MNKIVTVSSFNKQYLITTNVENSFADKYSYGNKTFFIYKDSTLDPLFSFLDKDFNILTDINIYGKIKKELGILVNSVNTSNYLFMPAYAYFFSFDENDFERLVFNSKEFNDKTFEKDIVNELLECDQNCISYIGGNKQFFRYFMLKDMYKMFSGTGFLDISDVNVISLKNTAEKDILKGRGALFLSGLYEGFVRAEKVMFSSNKLNQIFLKNNETGTVFFSFPFFRKYYTKIVSADFTDVIIFKRKTYDFQNFFEMNAALNDIFNMLYLKYYILEWIYMKNFSLSTLDLRTFEFMFSRKVKNPLFEECPF